MKHNSWCQTQASGVSKGKICSVYTTAAKGGNNDSRREEKVKCSAHGITKVVYNVAMVRNVNIIDLLEILTAIRVMYIAYLRIDS